MKKRQIRKLVWMYIDLCFEEHLLTISRSKHIRRAKAMKRLENQIRAKNIYKYHALIDNLHSLAEAVNDCKEGLNPF